MSLRRVILFKENQAVKSDDMDLYKPLTGSISLDAKHPHFIGCYDPPPPYRVLQVIRSGNPAGASRGAVEGGSLPAARPLHLRLIEGFAK